MSDLGRLEGLKAEQFRELSNGIVSSIIENSGETFMLGSDLHYISDPKGGKSEPTKSLMCSTF